MYSSLFTFAVMKNQSLFFVVLMIFSFLQGKAQLDSLQKGDIIFQKLDCGPLCGAIKKVTEGVDGHDFAHCAMLVSTGDSAKVIEAIGSDVRLTPLQQFLHRDAGDTVVVGRLKQPYHKLIDSAVVYAQEQLGQPYDDDFLPDNGKWYCSELLYASFKYANGYKPVFKLEPMTFKDPDTGQYMKVWVDYYKKLGEPIPEGVPGLNPGGISRSPKLKIIYLIK